MTFTVSHVRYPTEFAISFAPRGFAGSGAQLRRCGLRRPYAQISGRAPFVFTNGLSFGMRYRPFSLTVLVATCSFRSGMMRMILPTRLSSRCGLLRMATIARLSGRAVADLAVQHAPVGIAGASDGIERQLAHGMAARVQPHAHQLAGRSFERRIRRVRVGPLDEHALVDRVARSVDRCRHGVPVDVQARLVLGVGEVRHGQVRVFHVHRVELAGAAIVGIEMKAIEPVAISARDEKAMKQARPVVASVEVEVFRELLRLLVEDVERAVHVGDEQTVGPARLLANRVDPRQQHLI